MIKNHFSYSLHKLTVLAIIFPLTGCGFSFNDSGQSLATNDSRSVVLGDIDAGNNLDMVVANAGQGNRAYHYEKEEVDLFKRSE